MRAAHWILAASLGVAFTSSVTAQESYNRRIYQRIQGHAGFSGIPEVQESLAATADKLASGIAEEVSGLTIPDGQKYRIAVFKFGNDDWKIPLDFAHPPSFLQGSLVNGLQTLLAESQKFTVLLPDQLDQVLSTGTSDPQGLSGANLDLARTLMASYNLQVCVFGRFLLSGSTGDRVTVRALVVTADSESEVEAEVERAELNLIDNKPDGPLSGRFTVRFQVKPDESTDSLNSSSWVDLQLKRKPDPSTENLFYLVVDPAMKGRRYRILLSNTGGPAIGESVSDADRVFGAVVFIDGVSHVFKKRQVSPPLYGPQSGHPVDMPKDILTKPGRYLKQDGNANGERFQGATLLDGDFGHDKRVIVGFQKGKDIAGAFRFGEPSESVASELVGPVSKLGTIQVFFYPEVFTDDGYVAELRAQYTEIGTIAGEDVSSERFGMKVKNWFALPAETWNIVYRYEGDPSLPPALEDYP